MSFYLAMATPTLGVMAADSRLVYPGLGGLINDTPQRTKLRRLRGGWATGSSFASQWLDLIYAAIGETDAADTPGISAAIRRVRDSDEYRALETLGGWAAAMAKRPPGEEDRIGDLVVVSQRADGFGATVFDDRGAARSLAPFQPVLNTLREVPPETVANLFAQLVCQPAASEVALLRQVAAFFAALHERCGPEGSMSDRVEIALLLREADGRFVSRHLAPRPSSDVLHADDGALASSMEVVYA
jgi:hypothetical protein